MQKYKRFMNKARILFQDLLGKAAPRMYTILCSALSDNFANICLALLYFNFAVNVVTSSHYQMSAADDISTFFLMDQY